MADLSDILAAQSVKIIGSDQTGVEQTPVSSFTDGSLKAYSPGFSTASNTRPSVANSDGIILSANAARKYAYIMNSSGATIYIKFGASAVLNQGIVINSGSVLEITQNNLWLGDIHAIKTGATVNIEVFEGTP